MASNLFNTLTKIDNGRKRCIQAINNVGFDLADNTSLNEIANAIENCVEKSVETTNVFKPWARPLNWFDTQAILDANETKDIDGTIYYPVCAALYYDTQESAFLGKKAFSNQNFYIVKSDGEEQLITGDTTVTWAEGTKDKYIICYMPEAYTVSNGTYTLSAAVGGIWCSNGSTFNYGFGEAIELRYSNLRFYSFEGLAASNNIINLVFNDNCILDWLGSSGIYRTICYNERLEHIYGGPIKGFYNSNQMKICSLPKLCQVEFPNWQTLGRNVTNEFTDLPSLSSIYCPNITTAYLQGKQYLNILELPCGNVSDTLELPYSSVVKFNGASNIKTFTLNNNRVFEYGAGSIFGTLTLNGPQSYTFAKDCTIGSLSSNTLLYLDVSKVIFSGDSININCPNVRNLIMGREIDRSINLRSCINLSAESLKEIIENLATVTNGASIALPASAEEYPEDVVELITSKGWVIA